MKERILSFFQRWNGESKRPQEYTNTDAMKLNVILNKSIVVVAFLIPLFFLPFFNVPYLIGKGAILYIVIVILLIVWLIARLKDGDLIIPRSLLMASLATIPAVFLLASLFSDSIRQSLIGSGYEIGTFSAIFLLSFLTFLVANSFDTVKKIFSLYTVLFYSGIISFVYLFINYIFDSVSFFQSTPLSLIGSLNDTAFYYGLLAILSIVTIELIVLSKRMRYLVYATLVLSLIGLTIINFSTGWIIVGLFALLTFVYALSFGGKNITSGQRIIPVTSLVVMLMALFFVLANGPIGSVVSSTFNIQNTEVRPSWLGTGEVARSTIFGEGVKEAVLGGGPNRFTSKWVLHRPEGINSTIAWNTDFVSGVGILPTYVVTTGLLGLIVILLFLGVFLARGTQMVIQSSVTSDKITRYALVSSFFGGLYLWVVVTFYAANIVILSFAFIFTGIFIASLMHAGMINKYRINILQDPRISFISILILILILIFSIVGANSLIQRFGALLYYQGAVASINTGDINSAQQSLMKASNLIQQDYYMRDLSRLYIAKLNQTLQKDASEETIRAEFQEGSRNAVDSALRAVEINENNYLNWIVLAQSYQSLIPFGLGEGYESASRAYDKALELNPQSPSIYLDKARLELVQGNTVKARENIGKALELKSNYTAAIFLLSQIQAQEGELDQAIESTTVASLIAPNDMGVYFQLGFLKYQNSDFAGAASAFERSIELNPSYANAMYFLGLSYSQLGREDRAIELFEKVLELNPGNSEVTNIIANLRAGRGAFESFTPSTPIVQPPEERPNLPVEEE